MFLEKKSRYAKVEKVTVTTADGTTIDAIKLRRLPPTTGEPLVVKDRDQLDVLAQGRYADGTKFWHIADANTELEANDLVGEAGASLKLPRS